jgi:replicative superfamily II helicase
MKDGLNSLQLKAVNEYRILDGNSLLVVAPTSSGKTMIGELASAKAITTGKKSVFLLPYRALVNEKHDQFTLLYGSMGHRIIRCSGDYSDNVSQFVKGKYDIAFLTYEMFLNLATSVPYLLNSIGLVVLDEAQFITDPGRGITVELILTYLNLLKTKGVSPQLVVLSAVIGDTNNFEQWLGCEKLVSSERPVPLIEGVLSRDGIYLCKYEDGNTQREPLLDRSDIYQRKEKPSSQDLIVPLVRKLIANNEKVIIFRNVKGYAEGCAGCLSIKWD